MIPIPLHLATEFDGRWSEPFVARLSADSTEAGTNGTAYLVAEFPDRSVFHYEGGYFSLLGATAKDVDGDVVFLNPTSLSANRWIRAKSNHNTLLITEQCDQLCVMCSQPPKKTHVDQFEYFRRALDLAPQGMVIGLSGGEPTLHKHSLFDLLLYARDRRPDLFFHVLTNGQHFVEADVGTLRSFGAHVLWGVPLYAADATLHDEIVAKPGAFEGLRNGLACLGIAGAMIELRTVVLRQNINCLPELARLVARDLPFLTSWAIMQLENAGFAKNRWTDLFFDHSEDFTKLAQAVDFARVRGTDVQLFNFPLCTIPGEFRLLAPASISDWKNKYLDQCGKCVAKSACCGFFSWYRPEQGYGRVEAL
ncbi:His-Xaa-Ser system radical SAM maturase HxsC [Pacificispira sp.]|uniref:His-Xaa-Ser system radical SAM maturase HxsC n=1 Tax=Pacificispira sp. TaxID=2888761 RepID=UPI003B51F663